MNEHIKFQNFWINCLTENQKIRRIKKSFKILKKCAKNQSIFLADFKKNNTPDNVGFLYFEKTIENIWGNVDFIFSIKNKKYKNFSFYPTRCVMESAFRLDHFIRQNKKIQEDIAITECLRVCKRVWDMENNKNDENGMSEIKEHYDKFASLGNNYSEIDKVKMKNLDSFPNIFDILMKSKMYDIGWYYHYGFLSELTHGKLMHTIIKNNDLLSEYRRSLMYLIMMCYKALELFDVYFFDNVSQETQDVIKRADEITKKTKSKSGHNRFREKN